MTDYMRDAMDTAFKNRQETSGNIPIMEVSDFIDEQMKASDEYWQDIRDNIGNLVYAVAYAVSDHLVDTGQKALQDRIYALEQENRQLWSDNAKLIVRNNNQKQFLDDLLDEKESLLEHNQDNHDDLLVLRDENRDVLEENTYLLGAVERLGDTISEDIKQITGLERDVSRLLDKIDRLESEIDRMAGVYLEMCRKKWSLEDRLKDCSCGSSEARHPSVTQ